MIQSIYAMAEEEVSKGPKTVRVVDCDTSDDNKIVSEPYSIKLSTFYKLRFQGRVIDQIQLAEEKVWRIAV